MVMVWNLIERDSLHRLSGLTYLRELLLQPDVREDGNTLWIMANPKSAATNLGWLAENGISVDPRYVYMAPMYGAEIADDDLLALLDRLRPRHIILTIGAGPRSASACTSSSASPICPPFHCIGAAIASSARPGEYSGLGWTGSTSAGFPLLLRS